MSSKALGRSRLERRPRSRKQRRAPCWEPPLHVAGAGRGKACGCAQRHFFFGAMLYEMLTGQRAFHGDSLIATISSVLKDTPPPLHHVRREVEPPFEEVVDRCLRKNRDDRYASGTELAEALAAVAARPLPTR